MTRIVAHLTRTYLTGRAAIYMTGAQTWMMTVHVAVTALHATKGWRLFSHRQRTSFLHRRPSAKEIRGARSETFKRMTLGRGFNEYGIQTLQVRP